MKNLTKHLYLLLSVLIMALNINAQATEQNDSLRILWIGNSFTFVNDLPSMLQKIASSQKVNVSCTRFLKSGERLKGHLTNPQLINALKKGGWDYIIVQEQSSITAVSTASVQKNVYPYAHTINSLAIAGSPNAHVIFYMTWGHKYGNIRQIEDYPLDDNYIGMQERVKTSYIEMTHDNNAWCAPVGMAWKTVRSEKPALRLYKQDCYHPSVAGSYLSANVIFTTIYQKQYQSDYNADLDPEVAEYLQHVAQNTVLTNKKLLNIKHVP